MSIEKYCLLEDGTIEDCYYNNGEMRCIYKEGNAWFLDHDKFGINGFMIRFHHKIIKFGKTKKELKEYEKQRKQTLSAR